MSERDRTGEVPGRLTFIEIEQPISGLHLVISGCESFIAGDFARGEFLRFRPIRWNKWQFNLVVSEVADHLEKPPRLQTLMFLKAYHLNGIEINLDAHVRAQGPYPFQRIYFNIDAPRDLPILREELISRHQEFPQIVEQSKDRFGGLVLAVKKLGALLIGDVKNGNFMRLRLLTWNETFARLALSQVIAGRESSTKIVVVRIDTICSVVNQDLRFKFMKDPQSGRQLVSVIKAPREIAIIREKSG